MREIKFRAWDEDTKKMFIPDKIDGDGEGKIYDSYGCYDMPLMQFTGLKDKNGKGKEAYVDDIARDEHGQVFVIEWDYPLLARLQEIWFEVIGNIHSDPELLEKT